MSKKVSKDLITQYCERIPNFVELFTQASRLTVDEFKYCIENGKITEVFFYEALSRFGE